MAIGELILVAVVLGFRQGARRDVDRRRKESEALTCLKSIYVARFLSLRTLQCARASSANR
jgi:hypothetical protein